MKPKRTADTTTLIMVIKLVFSVQININSTNNKVSKRFKTGRSISSRNLNPVRKLKQCSDALFFSAHFGTSLNSIHLRRADADFDRCLICKITCIFSLGKVLQTSPFLFEAYLMCTFRDMTIYVESGISQKKCQLTMLKMVVDDQSRKVAPRRNCNT